MKRRRATATILQEVLEGKSPFVSRSDPSGSYCLVSLFSLFSYFRGTLPCQLIGADSRAIKFGIQNHLGLGGYFCLINLFVALKFLEFFCYHKIRISDAFQRNGEHGPEPSWFLYLQSYDCNEWLADCSGYFGSSRHVRSVYATSFQAFQYPYR